MHRYVIAVGSNIDPEKNVEAALEILNQDQSFTARSRFIWTAPVGYQQQDDFLNGAVYVESSLDYEDFRAYLKKIEKRLKRSKGTIKSGPRTIDLDIIIHNAKVKDPHFHTEPYVRKPVLELIQKQNITLL